MLETGRFPGSRRQHPQQRCTFAAQRWRAFGRLHEGRVIVAADRCPRNRDQLAAGIDQGHVADVVVGDAVAGLHDLRGPRLQRRDLRPVHAQAFGRSDHAIGGSAVEFGLRIVHACRQGGAQLFPELDHPRGTGGAILFGQALHPADQIAHARVVALAQALFDVAAECGHQPVAHRCQSCMTGIGAPGRHHAVVGVFAGRRDQPALLQVPLRIHDEAMRCGLRCGAQHRVGGVGQRRAAGRIQIGGHRYRRAGASAVAGEGAFDAALVEADQQRDSARDDRDASSREQDLFRADAGAQPRQRRAHGLAARMRYAMHRGQHVGRVVEAFDRGLGQDAIEESLPVAEMRRQARDRVLHVLERHRQPVLGLVRQAADQHFPGQHPEAVEVGAQVDLGAARLFGRHVGRAAYRHAGGGDAGPVTAAQGDAEIGQHRPLGLVEQHVLGLHVAMDHPAAVRVGQCAEQGFEDFAHPRFVAGEVALAQMPARQHRHHVIGLVLMGPADFVDMHDMRMVEAGDRARFVLEPATAGFVGQRFHAHDLDGHLAAQRQLLAKVNRGHAAVSENPQQAVTGNLRPSFLLILLRRTHVHPPVTR